MPPPDDIPPPDGEAGIRDIIEDAEEVSASGAGPVPPMPPMPDGTERPDLEVQSGDLPATARELRNFFAASGYLFDRDMPIKVVQPADRGPMIARVLTANNVVVEAHRLCQPVKRNRDSELVPVTLPERVAKMYLDMIGEWKLPPLAGISTTPLLASDGGVHSDVGYDKASGLWCCKVPPLQLPERPSRSEAEAALRLLRDAFKTFPFADAVSRHDPALGIEVVDLEQAPGHDESAMLIGLLTAVCRASLWLAPGLLVVAPQVSGAGSGKGLLVRAICLIAFGIRPRAFTAGHDRQELDKRIVAELVEAAPALFLDNVNGAVLRSETLASVITERPARVRLLGATRMVALNSTAFIVVTGNGLRVSEDLARRFVLCGLDAKREDPETRAFRPGFLEDIGEQRAELLTAALTIWRFGRQNAADLKRGRPLGSFETWCEWVRDPLLTLGCGDPVEQVERVKAHDPHRQRIADLFDCWQRWHGDAAIKAGNLAEPVRQIIDPQGRGRQFVVAFLGNLANTRAAGFVLTRQEAPGEWGVATYSLRRTSAQASDGNGHRGHGDHMDDPAPMPPMDPMPDEAGTTEPSIDDDGDIPADSEMVI
jgi:hypothetical protein